MAKFENNLYLCFSIKRIVIKFGSLSFYSLGVISVHTDKNAFIASPVETQQQFILLAIRAAFICLVRPIFS